MKKYKVLFPETKQNGKKSVTKRNPLDATESYTPNKNSHM